MPEIRERDKADQLKRKDKQPREKKSIGAPVKRSLRAAIGRNIRRQGNNSSQAESTAAADAHAAQQVQQAAESIMPRSVDAAQRMKYAFQQQRKKEAERYTHVTEEAPPVSESTSLSPFCALPGFQNGFLPNLWRGAALGQLPDADHRGGCRFCATGGRLPLLDWG